MRFSFFVAALFCVPALAQPPAGYVSDADTVGIVSDEAMRGMEDGLRTQGFTKTNGVWSKPGATGTTLRPTKADSG